MTKLTRKQKVALANSSTHSGTPYLDPTMCVLVKKGLFRVAGADYFSVHRTPEGDALAGEVLEELALEILPKLSPQALDGLLTRRYHPEHLEHGLGFERQGQRTALLQATWVLRRWPLGTRVAQLEEKRRRESA